MNGALVTAASGLAASAAWLENIASNVVQQGASAKKSAAQTASSSSNLPTIVSNVLNAPVPPDNLASDFVDQSLALASYRASAALFKTAEEMDKVTLDLVA